MRREEILNVAYIHFIYHINSSIYLDTYDAQVLVQKKARGPNS